MMGGVSPETCWAVKKHWNNKFYYTGASCWFFLWDFYYYAWIHEHRGRKCMLIVNVRWIHISESWTILRRSYSYHLTQCGPTFCYSSRLRTCYERLWLLPKSVLICKILFLCQRWFRYFYQPYVTSNLHPVEIFCNCWIDIQYFVHINNLSSY
jgi:hypothetical protein